MYLPQASNLSLCLHKKCDQAILPLPFPLCAFLPQPLPRPFPRHPISAGYKKCILKLQGATISLISASKAQNLHIYPFEQLQRFISLCRFNSTFLQKKFAFVRRQGSTLLVWFCLGAKPYMTTIHECKNNASFFLNLSTIQPNIVDYKRSKGFARHTQRLVLENMHKSDKAYTKYLLTRLPQAHQRLRAIGMAAFLEGEVVARHGELKDVNFSSSEIVFHIFTGLKIQHRI